MISLGPTERTEIITFAIPKNDPECNLHVLHRETNSGQGYFMQI